MRKPGSRVSGLLALVLLAGLAAPVLAESPNAAVLTVLVLRDGQPVPGALVSASDEAGKETVAITDAQGLALLGFRVPGHRTETVLVRAFDALTMSAVEEVGLCAGADVLAILSLRKGIPLQDISF